MPTTMFGLLLFLGQLSVGAAPQAVTAPAALSSVAEQAATDTEEEVVFDEEPSSTKAAAPSLKSIPEVEAHGWLAALPAMVLALAAGNVTWRRRSVAPQ